MMKFVKLTLASTASVGTALTLSACMQEPNLKPDFGTEVEPAEFSKMLGQIQQPDPYTIQKDEYAYVVRSTNIADQIYQIDKRWAYTVTNKAEVGNDYVFTYVREVREYDRKGAEKISQDQDNVSLAKKTTPVIPVGLPVTSIPSSEQTSDSPTQSLECLGQKIHLRIVNAANLKQAVEVQFAKLAAFPVQALSALRSLEPTGDARTLSLPAGAVKDAALLSPISVLSTVNDSKRIFSQSLETLKAGISPQTTTKVTFHNAKLQITNVAVPDFVQQRANCGGLAADKCRGALKAYILSYDQVIWEGEEGQRYSVSWVFTPDIPFFGSTMFPNPAGVIQSCSSTQMPYQGSRIKVTQCDEIKDFTFGTP